MFVLMQDSISSLLGVKCPPVNSLPAPPPSSVVLQWVQEARGCRWTWGCAAAVPSELRRGAAGPAAAPKL